MVVLLVVIGLAALPMYLLHRHQRARSTDASSPTAPGFDVPIALPPLSPAIPTALPVAQAPASIPTITRTSLLPHEFAGVCEGCHLILETPIVQVDRETVARFAVSDQDRALVMAGQQVVMPTMVHRLQAPLLGGETVLPHRYVGVCSNCHRVVDLGGSPPSPAAMAQARTRLLDRDLDPGQIARASSAPQSSLLRVLNYTFGAVALALFLLGMVYVVLKLVILSKPRAQQGRYRKQYHLKRWFQVHVWALPASTVAIVAHWLCSTRGNALLHLSLVLSIVLMVSGLLLRYRIHRLPFGTAGMRWLHTQRVLTCMLIVAAVVGHLLVPMR